MKRAGYTHRNGRRKKDEKTLVAVLEDILGYSDKQVRRLLMAKSPAKLRKPDWERATASPVRAAVGVRKADEIDGAKGTYAKDFLAAVDAILGTATGRRFLRKQALRAKT